MRCNSDVLGESTDGYLSILEMVLQPKNTGRARERARQTVLYTDYDHVSTEEQTQMTDEI